MEFCPDCNNLLYLKIEKKENDKVTLQRQCRNCTYKAQYETTDNKCIYTNPYNIDKLKYYIKKKANLRYDPTIPHIDSIPCPNKDCGSYTEGASNDVFYVCLDNQKLLYLYVCNNCMEHWTNK
jgi:DNA-directed RNA polymerase subunit M/transcription elongation factor TFIIS